MVQKLGEFLRQAREKSGLSLEQLSERTRVRIDNLAALEREDLDKLPGDPYVRGFIRIVCKELSLSSDEGLELYRNLRANSGLPEEITWSEENARPEPGAFERALQDPDKVVKAAKRARPFAVPVAILVVAAMAYASVKLSSVLFRGLGEKRDVALSKSASDSPNAESSEKASASGALNSNRDKSPSDEPPPALGGVDPSTGAQLSGVEGFPVPSPGALPDVGGEDAVSSDSGSPTSLPGKPIVSHGDADLGSTPPAVSESSDASTTRPGVLADVAPPAIKEPLVLEVQAVREAEITLLLDGAGFPRKRSLMAGESKSWKADSVVVLSVSDAGAIRLVVNGIDLGAAGPDGQSLTNHRVRR